MEFGDMTIARNYDRYGAHPAKQEGRDGWLFRVWAPNAQRVSVVGDFNNWNVDAAPMTREGGDWALFIPDLRQGDVYKYAVTGAGGKTVMKCDPYGFYAELRPATGSRLWDIGGYDWKDGRWKPKRAYDRAMNIYEVHLGSWKRTADGAFRGYRDLADELAPYIKDMGYTHVELLPVTEHPLDASWGYQCTGYFAPTARYGTPQDFMYFVDTMHRHGIGVILDWVPAHFCKDEQGLYEFDGTCCYEYADPNKREHAGWGTRVFDYGRPEVRDFLLSSAAFWLREYHIDGIRVDAVASMLYLDYDRQGGAWTPNQYGGRENLEAIDFLRELNRTAFAVNPNVLMVAEESTAWPLVTYPPEDGGLGFNMKWNMGWMNDMCHYLKMDPFFRQYHHNDLTFSMMYAFSENYILPLSHDEVVHMKGSMVNKMPGDYENQLRCLRGFYAYLLAHPGKKLMFMGAEIGQWHEWNAESQLDWYLLDEQRNRNVQSFFRDANQFYLKNPTLWEVDRDWSGFEWLVADDNHNNVLVFLRRDKAGHELICAVNFSPNVYEGYRFGVPDTMARYKEVFNTDDPAYGGSGVGNGKAVPVEDIPSHGKARSAAIRIPPFGAVFLRGEARRGRKAVKAGGEKTAGEADKADKADKTAKKAGKQAKALKKTDAKAGAKTKAAKAAKAGARARTKGKAK